MIRYIRLYLYFLRFSFSRAMEFRIDFFFRIVMDIFFYTINFGFYKLIFMHTDLLGGWTIDEVLIFMAGFFVIDAISMTVFANNLWALPLSINKGELDCYLVRPVSSMFFLSLRDFAANSFVNLLMAIGILVWALGRYPGDLSFFSISLFVVMIVLGALLRYFMRMFFIIPTFWFHSARGFEMIFFYLNRFIERPDQLFTGPLRVVLTTIFPFCLMASFPARILLDGFNAKMLWHFLVVLVLFFFGVRWFWRVGMKAYSSASS